MELPSVRSADGPVVHGGSDSAWSSATGRSLYRSDKEPYPLSEEETALLVAAATGVTGAILCEGDTQGGMVKSVGRTHPSAVGAHRTVLFFTNDDGLFLYQGTKHKMSKMKEYETAEDRDKVKGFYDEYTVKLGDGRFDLPRSEPGLFAHNLWVTNQPGTTLFMPVTDVSQDLIRLMVNMCDASGGARYTKRRRVLHRRRTQGNAAGPGARSGRSNGLLDRGKPLPLGRLEKIIVSWLCAEGRDDGNPDAARRWLQRGSEAGCTAVSPLSW